MIGFVSSRLIRPICLAMGLGVISASAWGQAVTLPDIEGAVIEVRLLRQQTIRREGQEVSNQAQTDMRVAIGSGGNIQISVTPTGHSKRGTRVGKPTSGTFVLDETRGMNIGGGGHGVWTFDSGTLTFLRIFKGGALKRTMAFARTAEGLTCQANENLVREEGVKGVVTESPFDGVPIVILSAKQISSTCRVTKQGRPTAQ